MVPNTASRIRPVHPAIVLLAALALMLLTACSQSTGKSDAPCVWTGKYKDWIYQERQLISTYTVPLNVAVAKRMVPWPFELVEPARVRISVLDLYEMAAGATYKEAEVSLLVRHREETGWYIVTLPLTDSEGCGGGVQFQGFPKIVRRVTFEREEDRYVGVLYQHGGREPEFTMRLKVHEGALGDSARGEMNRLSQMPSYTVKGTTVFRFPGYPRPMTDLAEGAMPAIFDVKFGYPHVDIPFVEGSVLYRLGIVQPDVGYWMRMRHRYALNPQLR